MSFNFSKSDFESELEKSSGTVLFKKISSDTITPVLSSLKIFEHFDNHHFLFESAENGNNKGRFSVLGFMPDLAWKCTGNESFINNDFHDNKDSFQPEKGNALENLRQLNTRSHIHWDNLYYGSTKLPSICSGIFGYMGYDIVKLVEEIPNRDLEDEINIPDAIFIRPQLIIVFDSLFDCTLICAPVFADSKDTSYESAVEKISMAEELLHSPYIKPKIEADTDFNFTSNCSEEDYSNMVEKAKAYITDGDIFQVLPSQRLTSKFDKNLPPFSFYRSLRSINPSPFLFYLKIDDFVLTGSSPEIMVSLKDDTVTIRPLAGTRKRGKNPEEDAQNAVDLLKDEKEIAEHLMLIDLGRHDVGKVSKPGTVKVTEKMVIEYYSHVMHISSNVEGTIRDDLDALDALTTGLPAGTVSGAPKIRAMEVIEELENVKRSFYAGCVGYFASNGDMETCITLRSALIKDEKIYLQAGAGVVFDSDPKSEHQECLNKAQALITACNNIKL